MTVSNSLVIKLILAVVSCVFTYVFVGEAFTVEDTTQLLAVAATGFGLAAIILP